MVPVKLQIDVLIINKKHSDCLISLQLYSLYSLGEVRAKAFAHSHPHSRNVVRNSRDCKDSHGTENTLHGLVSKMK